MTGNPLLLVLVAGIMFAVLGGVTLLSHIYSLNGIKSKTVGDGQHGTARWATKSEIKKIYKHVPFEPERWRKQAAKGQTPTGDDGKPLPQGIVVGCTGNTTAMVDTGDVHALMIGAVCPGSPPIPRATLCETTDTSPSSTDITYRSLTCETRLAVTATISCTS